MSASSVVVDAAWTLSAAALVLGSLVLVASRSPRTALGIFLDLLLAAALLRLAVADSWSAIAAAAAVVAVRKLVVAALTADSPRIRMAEPR